MPASARLNPPQVLVRLLIRIEKRVRALEQTRLTGYEVAIAELEVERNYLLRAKRYLETVLGEHSLVIRAPGPSSNGGGDRGLMTCRLFTMVVVW